jgi:hypothetical protein
MIEAQERAKTPKQSPQFTKAQIEAQERAAATAAANKKAAIASEARRDAALAARAPAPKVVTTSTGGYKISTPKAKYYNKGGLVSADRSERIAKINNQKRENALRADTSPLGQVKTIMRNFPSFTKQLSKNIENANLKNTQAQWKNMMKPIGADKIPAMVAPNEFIMSRGAVSQYGVDTLEAMNKRKFSFQQPGYSSSAQVEMPDNKVSQTITDSAVYNYSVNVNVATNADSNTIARTVISQIKQIDSQRIRGVGLR